MVLSWPAISLRMCLFLLMSGGDYTLLDACSCWSSGLPLIVGTNGYDSHHPACAPFFFPMRKEKVCPAGCAEIRDVDIRGWDAGVAEPVSRDGAKVKVHGLLASGLAA